MQKAIELTNITKTFGDVIANKDINLTIKKGEILALLGENGSGKTTLLNILSGIYYPDNGKIFIDGKEVKINSPKDAFNMGIGMVHQHFKLIDVFSACENIILGLNDGFLCNMKKHKKNIDALAKKYGFIIDLDKKVFDMSISEKQTIEIVKQLYRGTDFLILDEPTAVLTPQEIIQLFKVLKVMKNDGKSIIIITHKLQEVLSISDRVSVLRKGELVGTVDTKDATKESLTEMMVGEKVILNIERSTPTNVTKRLEISHLNCIHRTGVHALKDVSFDLNAGEILGVAGIAGSGQRELLEAIAGVQHCKAGSSIIYYDPISGKEEQLIGKNPKEIKKLGISFSFVPEDRLGMGLIGNMDIIDNMMLRSYENGKTPFLEYKEPTILAKDVKDKLEVITPSIHTKIRKLSGGNVQKVLVGREIASFPKVLMTAYAVRGLDINTSYTIYNIMNDEKKSGTAVLYVGEDLDVLLALCDRIMVICNGRITGIVDARTSDKQTIGHLMTNNEISGEENE
ncbi:MAG: ABC transporter ATP-binding protein [Bacilli bacterium]|nr:ABC transporter ATP-binding protein [Bacilli bacterium]